VYTGEPTGSAGVSHGPPFGAAKLIIRNPPQDVIFERAPHPMIGRQPVKDFSHAGRTTRERSAFLASALLVQRRNGRMPRLVSARPLALVIEDYDDTREVYAVVLRLEGFTVESASNGQEGLQKAMELLPDIIITDLSMPIMDGWETIRRLRGRRPHASHPDHRV
jgi:PleD family two-component response regulator